MLPHDVIEALSAEGFRVRRSVYVSLLRSPAESRFAAFVELEGGRRIKVRRARNEGRAATVVALCQGLAVPELPRIHARRGSILIEEWIEGTPLSALGADERHESAAAAWLGRLHSISTVNGVAVRTRQRTGPWHEKAVADLQQLLAGNVLDAAVGAGLERELAASDPGSTEIGVTHLDLCAENLVLDRSGTLRVVDNEWLGLGALDLDLATTWHRWPMPADRWARFIETYSETRQTGLPSDRTTFWRIVTLLKSAAYRHRMRMPGVEGALARLEPLVHAGRRRLRSTCVATATARERRPSQEVSP